MHKNSLARVALFVLSARIDNCIVGRMTRERPCAAPKGNAKTLRQKGSGQDDTSESALRGAYAKGATGKRGSAAKGISQGKDGGRKISKGYLSASLYFCVLESVVYEYG